MAERFKYRPVEELNLTFLNPARLRRFTFEPDLGNVPQDQLRALPDLAKALRSMEELFHRQDHPQSHEVYEQLVSDVKRGNEVAMANLDAYSIFNGPVAITPKSETVPLFEGIEPLPEKSGGTNYRDPARVITDDFMAGFLQAKGITDPSSPIFSETTIVSTNGTSISTTPFAYEYAETLSQTRASLRSAASVMEDSGLARYLRARGDSLTSDFYYPSDVLWVKTPAQHLDVIIGPLETYHDRVLGKKAAYAGMVTVNLPEESARLSGYASLMQELEENLPQPQSHAKKMSDIVVPVSMVDIVAMSGDYNAHRPHITIAQTLPNDEKVLDQEGRKILIFRNVIAGFRTDPAMLERMVEPSLHRYVSTQNMTNSTMGHEVSHSLGPKRTTGNVDVTTALGKWHNTIEELKADLLAMYNMPLLVNKGLYTPEEMLGVWVEDGLMRNLPVTEPRIGRDAHYVGNLMKLNYFLESGAIKFDGSLFTVDFDKFHSIVTSMTREVLGIQSSGSQQDAERFVRRWAVWGQEAQYSAKVKEELGVKFYNLVKQPHYDLPPG